jgi:hypothetical protein
MALDDGIDCAAGLLRGMSFLRPFCGNDHHHDGGSGFVFCAQPCLIIWTLTG